MAHHPVVDAPPDAPDGAGGSDATTSGPPRPRARRVTRSTLAVGAVAALAGAMFATNASLFRGTDDRHPQNLVELVAAENARLEEATLELEALRGEVDALVDDAAHASDVPDVPPEVGMASGRVAVVGPGLVVSLWDAPVANAPPSARPDDLLVHQQDLEAVINALWSGGAEAMTIQGHRVTSRTSVRCVGNVLLLHGRTYSPPYEIAAIGDPEDLLAALAESEGVQIYLQYVEAVRLGWSVQERSALEMPAAENPPALRFASVVAAGLPDGAGALAGRT